MANPDLTPDKGEIPVPSEQDLQRIKQNSDQAMVSQQEIEQAQSHSANETVRAQGKAPLPVGQREDEDPDDTDDLLRSDMVNAGD